MDAGLLVLVELLWYVGCFTLSAAFEFARVLFVKLYVLCRPDSIENDNVQGLGHNDEGFGIVAFRVSDLGFSYIVSSF